MNTLLIRNRVDAKSGYFFLSGDVTRSSPVLHRERQSKMQISRALRRMLCCQYSQRLFLGTRVNPDTCERYVSDTCGRANSICIRIRADVEIFESGKKKLRIQKYLNTCGHCLYLITSTRKLKDHSVREGIFEFRPFSSCWPSSGGHIWLLATIRNE